MANGSSKKRFTEQMLERLTPPKQGRAEYADDVCPGLVLRVTDRGVKTFSVIYKVPGEGHTVTRGKNKGQRIGGVSETGRLLRGHQHRLTLGQWPVLRLPQAREEARKIISEATEGRDPREARREHNLVRHTNTFEAVLARYVEQDLTRNVQHWKMVQRVLEMHVLPEWSDLPLRDIRRKNVHELLDEMVADDRLGTAREVRKHLSRMFNWALDREIVVDSPLHGLKRTELKNNDDAGRSLTDAELRAVWQGASSLGYPFGSLYQLLILTGQRRGEWANALRSEISGEKRWLEVPRTRHKSGRDHIVPLADEAWAILDRLPAWEGNDYYLLSSRAGKRPVSGFSQGKTRLDELALKALRKAADDPAALLPDYRVHDFRVTCETRLANLGFNQEARDAVLGHAKAGLQKTYNKHDYLDEKRAALAAYASHIVSVVGAAA